jgi:hypothetical protein
LRGRHGGVFPAFPAIGFAGNEDHRAERRFAHVPDGRASAGVQMWAVGGTGQDCDARAMASALALRFFGRPRAHFDEKKADAGGELVKLAKRKAFAAHEFNKQMVEAFEADGAMLERERNSVGGEEWIVESRAP